MTNYGPQLRKLIVGLDFGTTHTGISYAWSDDDEVMAVDKWPTANGALKTAQKNPTLIAYLPGIDSMPWGYQIGAQSNICAWMKYHLDKNYPSTKYDDPGLTEAISTGLFSVERTKTPDEVTIDYLKEVFKFAVRHLTESVGALGSALLDVTTIQWWLAKPAIWGNQAQLRLQKIVRTAADHAEFFRPEDEFNFVTEADAAAFTLLRQAAADDDLNAGDTVMICDCGGGTVDVAVYMVSSISPIKVKEVVSGEGGKCGSSCIDLQFDKFMLERFGKAYENLDPSEKKFGSVFMKKFETHKHAFGAGDDPPLFEMELFMDGVDTDVPDMEEWYDDRDGTVRLTRSDMDAIFRPTVERVMELIAAQHKAATRSKRASKVNRLMLAGGFARSQYLQSRVKEWCSQNNIEATFLSNDDSWGAVACGAVLGGLERIDIETRLSRFHCGILCDLIYRADLDAKHSDKMYRCNLTGRMFVSNCVDWYSKKGDEVTEHSKKTASYYHRLSPRQKHFSASIVCCGATHAPRHFSEDLVQIVGNLEVHLSAVELKKYEVQMFNSRERAIKFDYRIEETIGASQGSLTYRALTMEDQPLGHAQIHLPRVG
ncbi:actin-like ATPase domain-containing protein [Phialemonium atrogriseum]|uniref:Actin-like ATPase domain-containing protein n=1 Tax=Phialemonium atrogriseum TaxID=1093897 RepID=A0AAJ0BRE7_9PEZI|nr:actin-like ATPase domain-containing protein [Phialemonium atrogriseum]KAK1763089.1 actin-like ATPase domain-containing protein [Phialemonium atrogriseum]